MITMERKARILYKLAEMRMAVLTFPSAKLRVMLANTPEELSKGLSGLDSLSADTGMLFTLQRTGPARFWMRDTRIPLDIAFLDEKMRILSIQRMEPHTGAAVYDGPIKYAVETNAGWFAQNGVEVGDVGEYGGRNG